MDTSILRQFRVKRGHHVSSLLYQHRITIVTCQNPGTLSDTADNWRADENGLEFSAAGRNPDNTAVQLAAISIPLDSDVQKLERFLLRIDYFGGEQNRAGAAAIN